MVSAEQRRIADILDKADAIRRRRKQAIALTEELLRSTFLEMFGDPVTNPKGWEVKALGEVCELVRGSSPRPKGDPRYFGGTVPRLMVADMTRDGLFVSAKIDSLTEAGARLSRPVPEGTVVMAVSGNVGVAAQLVHSACIHDGFVGFCELRGDEVLPEYLLLLLRFMSSAWHQEQAGAIFQNLTTTDVKARAVPIPPMSIQKRFVQSLRVWRSWQRSIAYASQCQDTLFASLVDRAFSGRLSA